MSSLPTWAAWAIVAACPLLGPVIAFLVFLAVAVLDRWITGAREAPVLVPAAASTIARFRGKLSLRPMEERSPSHRHRSRRIRCSAGDQAES